MSLDRRALLTTAQEEFLALLRSADPGTSVPWCGEWRVHDLAVHLADIHHWAAGQARREAGTPLGPGPFDMAELYGRCAAQLRATLAELAGDVGVRAPAGAPIPRLDLAWASVARPEVWADTVDEVVTVMHPRQVRMGRCPELPAAVRLVANDTVGSWLLHHAAGAPDVEVSGPAAALALLLWRRVLPDDPVVRVAGDPAALDEALALRLTP